MNIANRIAFIAIFALITDAGCLQAEIYSSLAFPGPDGKLDYAGYANEGQTSTDNRMIDFSHAGYKGGGVAIPWVPVALTLEPVASGGDDYDRIAAAITTLGAMPLSPSGFRGALLLKAGTYKVSKTLLINKSGIIIRGEGQHSEGTVINYTKASKSNLFEFSGPGTWQKVDGTSTSITDVLVPCSAYSFNVSSTSNYRVGDQIVVNRTPNQAWIDLLDMAQYGWNPKSYTSKAPRTITAISGNTVTIDTPLTHAIESQYGGGVIWKYTFNAITNIGIERLRMESSYTSNADESHGWTALRFTRAKNAWARQLTAKYFSYSCVSVEDHCLNVTVEDCANLDPKSQITGSRRYSFKIDSSTCVLFQRCYSQYGRHDFVTQANTPGPSAFVDSLAENTKSDTGPHHRYSEGILFDNIKAGQIYVQNRKESGTGHGWAGAQITFWNCEASSRFICDTPAAAMNFAIGCVGERTEGRWAPEAPYGFWESRQMPVTPRSLYYKQLEDRLGTNALLAVTNANQLTGTIWRELSTWQGDSEAPGLPTFTPVQVNVGNDAIAELGSTHKLNAAVRYPLPPHFSSTGGAWTQLRGPTAIIADASTPFTTVDLNEPGTYEFEYSISQQDNSDSENVITYNGADTVIVRVAVDASILSPPLLH